MEMYLLKSAACLAVLMIFYKFLLEKENMHSFKRWYLLAAVLVSLIIPGITLATYTEPVAAESLVIMQSDLAPVDIPGDKFSYLPVLLWSLYGIGVLFFGIKFILNLRIILLRIKRNPKIPSGETINVLLRENLAPHTFWDYIFLNRDKYEKKEIPKEVFQHEQAHADQRHSADILIMELLQVIFWFNPLLYMVSRAIRLNHEFLADRAVLNKGIQPALYQKTLLAFSSNAFDSNLVNSINYQSIKKRFTVMKTKTSKNAIWTRGLLLLPVLTLLLYSFSSKEVISKETEDLQPIPVERSKVVFDDKADSITVNFSEVVIIQIGKDGNLSINNSPATLKTLASDIEKNRLANKNISRAYIEVLPEVPQKIISDVKNIITESGISEIYLGTEGEKIYSNISGKNLDKRSGSIDLEKATPKMIEEYNALVRRMNRDQMLKDKEAKRILFIESLMTSQQKENAVQRELKILQFPSAQEEATPKMLVDYNKWAEHYNKYENTAVIKPVLERMKHIYSIMTPQQRKNSAPFPSFKPNQVIEDSKNSARDKTFREKHGEVPPPPPPPPAPPVTNDGDVPPPPPPPPAPANSNIQVPPPPPPPSPVEAVKMWIDEDAEFFYNGKKVTGQQALRIVQENNGKNLSVQVEENSSGKTVKISDNKKAKTSGSKTSAKKYTNPMKRSETIEHLRELAAEGVVFTYLGKEISVNETIRHLERKVTLRYSEVDSRRIMRVEDL